MSHDSDSHSPTVIPLIGRDDPPPFVVLHEHGTAPALIICDHASRAFPRGMRRLGLPELPSWQHIAWDIGAGELARGLSNALDAPAVLAGYSRLIVDCNEFERRVRLASFFDPYHEAIAAMLAGFRAREVVPLVVSVHTFTPTMSGVDRPWHVGVLWDKDEANARRLIAGLREVEGLVVGDNEPYSGKHPSDYTMDHHAEAAGLPHVCIEVRQDQFESPAGTERWVRLLARLLSGMLRDPGLRRLADTESAWRCANLR